MRRMPGMMVGTKVINDVVGEDFVSRFRDRIELREQFNQAPALAAVLDPSTINQTNLRLYTVANKQFTVSGTNATSSVLDTAGGFKLTTGTTTSDDSIVFPAAAINSVATSIWNKVQWYAQYAPRFSCTFQLSSAVLTTQVVHVGLKLTANSGESDNDFCVLAYDTGSTVSATNLLLKVRNGGGTMQTIDTGIAASLSTPYTFEILVATSGVWVAKLNGRSLLKANPRTLDSTGTAVGKLATSAAFLPCVSILTGATTGAGADRSISVRQLRMSRALS